MSEAKFFLLEPSKVGNQHITLIQGYISALRSSDWIRSRFHLTVAASQETIRALGSSLRDGTSTEIVPVIDPNKRRMVRKTILEFLVVFRYLRRLRDADRLLVTCVMPTSLCLVELASFFIRRRGAFVVLHSEVEGLVSLGLQKPWRYEYWATVWLRLRRSQSELSLVVLDDFIKHRLLATAPEKLREEKIVVLHHPVLATSVSPYVDSQKRAVCFIGYRTRFKGFDQFQRLATMHTDLEFYAIGAGRAEVIPTGHTIELRTTEDYMRAIAACSVAVFPYSSGYCASLSAAAIDALALGLVILCLDRPFFRSLAATFGPDHVRVCESIDEMASELREICSDFQAGGRSDRLQRVERSKYGLVALAIACDTIFADRTEC